MAHKVKRIARGPSTKVNAYAGPAGELVMDTTSNDLVLETGVQGGVRMAKASTSLGAANGLSVTAGGTLGEATTVSGVDATTSAKGVVQLSDSTTGTSQTKAATEKAVADALTAAKSYTDTHSGGSYSGTAPIVVSGSTISVSDATTSAKGVVQLNNATNSTSQTQAATPKAVSDALAAAKSYTDSHSGGSYTGSAPIVVSGSTISVSNATTSSKGVVQVGTNISVSSGTISVASGSTSATGVVQLNNATNSSVQTQAATPKAVSDALAAAKTYADGAKAHAAMPNLSQATSLTVPSSGGTVTAPADGYITANFTTTANTGITIHLFSSKVGNTAHQGAGKQAWATIPVSKNDSVQINYSTGGSWSARNLWFVYANGA